MTLDRVAEAVAQLQADGITATQRAVLRKIGGSKRDVARHLQTLRAQAAPSPPSVIREVPTPPPDPVTQAEQRLAAAEQALAEAREDLLHAKLALLATQRLPVEGVLHGSLHSADEIH